MINQEDIRKQIVNDIIIPSYKKDILCTIELKSYWSKINKLLICISYILYGTSSIVAFSASSFPEYNLGFVSGVLGLIALKITGFTYMFSKYNHIKTIETNNIMKNIGIDLELTDSFDDEESKLIDNK